MKPLPRVAIVMPVYNQVERTLRFLRQFGQVRYPDYHLIVVDDGSTDSTSSAVARAFPQVTVLRGDGNLWWAGAANLGVRHALAENFDYVLTINNDTRLAPDFLTHLVATAEASPRTLVGSRIHFASEPTRIWAIGATMNWATGTLFHLAENGRDEREVLAGKKSPVAVQALTGCGTLVPCACYREVGPYDAERYPQYHADVEFVLRARRHGYQPLVDLRAVVWNDSGNTTAYSVSRYRDFFFSRRSAVYWRPLLAIHRQYCPRWLAIPSLVQHYARFFWFHAPALRTLKRGLRQVLSRRMLPR